LHQRSQCIDIPIARRPKICGNGLGHPSIVSAAP
jgi:hypothetical protein